MDLAETGGGVGMGHGDGLGHGGCSGTPAPRVRTKMVAAEQDAVGGKTHCCGDAQHEGAEIGGGYAGIAAVLIDPIAGRFDTGHGLGGDGLVKGSFDHKGMGRADRGQTGAGAGIMAAGRLARAERAGVMGYPVRR